MNIPAMIGAKGVLSADANGKNAIVDGFTGTIYIDPDEATINEMTKKKKKLNTSRKRDIASLPQNMSYRKSKYCMHSAYLTQKTDGTIDRRESQR